MDHFARLGLPAALELEPASLDRAYFALQRQWHPDRFVAKPADERAQGLGRSGGAERRLPHAEGSAEPRRLPRRAEGRRDAGRRQDDRRSGAADGSDGSARGAARGGSIAEAVDALAGQGARRHEGSRSAGLGEFVLGRRQAGHQKGAPSPALPRQVRRGSACATHAIWNGRVHDLAGDPRAGRNAAAACRRGLAGGRHRSRHDQLAWWRSRARASPPRCTTRPARRMVPSVVAYPSSGGVLVGDEARAADGAGAAATSSRR